MYVSGPLGLKVEVSLHSLSRGGFRDSRIWQEIKSNSRTMKVQKQDLYGYGLSASRGPGSDRLKV